MANFSMFLPFVVIVQKGVFPSQNMARDFFLSYFAKNKKVEKDPIFGPRPQTNPFGKKANFSVFLLLVFIVQKGVFSFQNMDRDFFLPYFAKNENVEQIPLLDQNHGVTPLEKGEIFDFLIPCFYSLERLFFFLEYRQRLFFLPILPNTKTWKKSHFWTKTMD